jgi:hypothetical protein
MAVRQATRIRLFHLWKSLASGRIQPVRERQIDTTTHTLLTNASR